MLWKTERIADIIIAMSLGRLFCAHCKGLQGDESKSVMEGGNTRFCAFEELWVNGKGVDTDGWEIVVELAVGLLSSGACFAVNLSKLLQ